MDESFAILDQAERDLMGLEDAKPDEVIPLVNCFRAIVVALDEVRESVDKVRHEIVEGITRV